MCKWGTNKTITIERQIIVDSCLAEEVLELNNVHLIRTESSCCGHGKVPPQITIRAADQAKARALCYDPVYPDSCEQGDPLELGIMIINSITYEEDHSTS